MAKRGHLWCLSEELVALAFFTPDVSTDMKIQMKTTDDTEGTEHLPDRISVDIENTQILTLAEFVTKNIANFSITVGLLRSPETRS